MKGTAMTLTQEVIVDRREILADGTIQARYVRVVKDGDEVISRSIVNRKVFSPGADMTGEDASVQRIAAIEHTPEKIATREAAVEARRLAKLEREAPRPRIGEEE